MGPATVADLFNFESNQKNSVSVGRTIHSRIATDPYPVNVPDAYNCPRRMYVIRN